MTGIYNTFMGPQNRAVTMKLLWFSFLMITLPLGTYFFLLHIIFEGNKLMVGWSAVGAVVVSNIIIACYVIMACTEEDPTEDKEDFRGMSENIHASIRSKHDAEIFATDTQNEINSPPKRKVQ